MQNAKQLLSDVSERLEIFEDTQKKAGERFNIFSITKIERREVDTHSAMIAELLNPQGRHGQDDKFLIQFLKVLSAESPIDTKNARVFKEKSFAGLGRVDILIVLDDHVFVIENKVDAEDGHKQLQSYKKILDTYFKGKTGHLIYLTKYGSAAEKFSLGTVKDDEYHRISYKNHILNWLAACIDEVSLPLKVKYALEQYQDIVEKITGKSMNHELNNELVKILIEGNNLKSAQKISNLIEKAKGQILFNFFEELEKLDSVTVITNESLGKELEKLTYDETKCRNWFKSKNQSQNVGLFFDIGISDILFRVEVASRALYYGAVPIERNYNGEYELAHNWEEFTSDYFEKKNWQYIKWFAIPMKDAIQVWDDVELIRGENAQNFIEEVEKAIDELRKVAAIK